MFHFWAVVYDILYLRATLNSQHAVFMEDYTTSPNIVPDFWRRNEDILW